MSEFTLPYGTEKDEHVCYVLRSETTAKTYCGYSNWFQNRIRCHNGFKKGGAKYTTSGRPWKPLFIVKGFRTKREGLHFEYAMKHTKNRIRGVKGRIQNLNYVINKKKWTKVCEDSCNVPLTIIWYDKEILEKAKLEIEFPDQVSNVLIIPVVNKD